MNINQIHYFLAIVKTKSFSEAAYDLFISQSSISKQIKALEDELGITIFTRSSKQRVLTPAGQIFYRYAKQMYELHKDLLTEVEHYKNSMVCTLRIGNIPVIPMYTNFNIGAKLAMFQNSYKESPIKFETYEASQREILRDVYNGYTDFALVREECIPDSSNFDMQICAVDKMVLVCNKNHPLAKLKKVELKDISAYQLFLLGKESELRQPVMDAFAGENLKVKLHGESLKPKIIQGMLTVGDDVSILPDNVVDLHTFSQLCIVPLAKKIESKVVMLRLKDQNKSNLTQTFWHYWEHEVR